MAVLRVAGVASPATHLNKLGSSPDVIHTLTLCGLLTLIYNYTTFTRELQVKMKLFSEAAYLAQPNTINA